MKVIEPKKNRELEAKIKRLSREIEREALELVKRLRLVSSAADLEMEKSAFLSKVRPKIEEMKRLILEETDKSFQLGYEEASKAWQHLTLKMQKLGLSQPLEDTSGTGLKS